MARIIFPEDFISQKLLLDNVIEKHTDDGTSSPLIGYLTQQEINLASSQTAFTNAIAIERNRAKWAKLSEDWREKRDLKFDPVFGRTRDYYQFLKKFYKPNFRELGNWGAPITATGKINYPSDFMQQTVIFDALKDKYDSFSLPPPAPAANPLQPYLNQHGLSIATDTTQTNTARENHVKFEAFSRNSEDAREDRDNLTKPIATHLRGIGGYLLALNTNNPKQAGAWGFTIDDSPRAPKQVVSKVKLSSQFTITSCILGGTFKNIGSVPLNVYKGKTSSGAFVTVLPGEMYGIAKGFSTITVVNVSTTTTGVFSAIRSK